MAYAAKSLVRIVQIPVGETDGSNSGGAQITVWGYATKDAAATVETAGYFNNARARLTVGDSITCTFAQGGTPILKSLRVMTVPATGNITVGQNSVTAG